jgi:hypothetical protein
MENWVEKSRELASQKLLKIALISRIVEYF